MSRVEAIETRLDAGNAASIIGRYDIVADGSDNAETRYLVSDACYFAKRTLVFGAVGPFDGYVSTFKPHAAGCGRHAVSQLSLPVSRGAAAGARSPTAPRWACSAPSSA